MNKAKKGDRVNIHYTEKLETGEVLDTNKDNEPLTLTIGSNLVPLLEKATKGMQIGEKKTVEIAPENAHGQRREELILNVKKKDLPEKIKVSKGQQLNIKKSDGTQIKASVVEVDENYVKLDTNHPLAGKSLFFDLELVDIF